MRKPLFVAVLAVGLSLAAFIRAEALTLSFTFSDKPDVIIVDREDGGYERCQVHGYYYRTYTCYERYSQPRYRYRTYVEPRSYRDYDGGFTFIYRSEEKDNSRYYYNPRPDVTERYRYQAPWPHSRHQPSYRW